MYRQTLIFKNGKTKYLIISAKNDYFDAIRITAGAKAMYQPILIRCKPYADGTVAVTNLNNKKTVRKDGFSTRTATPTEIKMAKQTEEKYKTMQPLPSWTSNRRFR